MYKSDCIILAAGKSSRMDLPIGKQFVELSGKPILYYSLHKMINNENINEIYLVLNEKFIDYCRDNILNRFFKNHNINIVKGGESRQESVYNALKVCKGEYVLIHDSARPFVSETVISEGVKYAHIYGASSSYVKPVDTMKINLGDKITTLKREDMLIIQTPQCFKKEKLMRAYDYVNENSLCVTDESSVLDLIDEFTYFYLGDRYNIKITTKEDLDMGEVILKNISRRDYSEDI